MACIPCTAAAVSTVGAPLAIPAALAGYVGYNILSKKKCKKYKKIKKCPTKKLNKSFKKCLKKCSKKYKKSKKKKITCEIKCKKKILKDNNKKK